MKLCTACRRHVRPSEGACPFCGEVLHAGEAPRLGAVVLLGALGAACALRPIEDSATGEGTSGSGVGTSGASASSGAAVTTSGAGTSTSEATSTTGELTSSSDADALDFGCAFYGVGCGRFDIGGTKQCDQWVQDCPRGEKCMPFSGDGDNSWESLKCVPVMETPGQPGDPCTVEGSGTSGIDSCDKGVMCWDVDAETNQGTCVAMCTGTPDNPKCADPNTGCMIANDGVLSLCMPDCDPLIQDCPEGELCIYNPQDSNQFLCVLDASGEEGQAFDACEFVNACDVGLFCANPALAKECDPQGVGCCLPFCDLTMPTCIGEGQQCLPWHEDGQAPPGLEDVGVCGIPL